MSTALAVLQLAAALAVLGLGPLARLLPDRSRLEVVLCAPAMGSLLVTVATTLLLLLGVPVHGWVRPGFVVAALASLALWHGRAPEGRRPTRGATRLALAAALLTAGLLVAPSLAGGRVFELLRGNGLDGLCYMGQAQLLGDRGLPPDRSDPIEEVLARGRVFPTAEHYVRFSRWASSAGLAWSARLLGRSPLEALHGHLLVCLLALQGPAWALLARAGAGRAGAALLSSALCTGAWAGLLLDLEVVSHLGVLPMTGLLLLAATSGGPGARLLLGAALGGVLVHYTELVPLVAFGLALALGLGLRGGWRPRAGETALVALGLVVVGGPSAPFLVGFLRRQAEFAATSPGFPGYFQQVILGDPLLGAAALWPLADRGAAIPLTNGLLGLLAAGLGVAWVATLPSVVRGGPTTRLLGGLAAAGVLQAAALAALGRPWPFSKAVSYGIPFVALALGAATLPAGVLRGARPRGLRLARAAVLAWAALQLLVALDRTRAAATGREPPRAVPNHPDYRQLDPDARPIVDVAQRLGRQVTLFTGDPYHSDLVALTGDVGLRLASADLVLGLPFDQVQRARQATRPSDLLVVRRDCAGPRLLERALALTGDLALVPADAGLAWAPERNTAPLRPDLPPHALVLHAWAPRALEAELVIERLSGPLRFEVLGLEGVSVSASVEGGAARASLLLALPAGFSQVQVVPAAPIDVGALRLVERAAARPGE